MGDNLHEAIRAIAAGVSEGLLREYLRTTTGHHDVGSINVHASSFDPDEYSEIESITPSSDPEAAHTYPADLASAAEQLTRGLIPGHYDPMEPTDQMSKWM